MVNVLVAAGCEEIELVAVMVKVCVFLSYKARLEVSILN